MLAALLIPAPAAAQENGSLVRVDPVRREPLSQTVPVLGRLVARQAGVVAARIRGPIRAFRVEVGDRVKAGQVIAVLDAETMAAERDLAAGQVAKAKAELATRKAELALARLNLKRAEGLKSSAAFNQGRFDDARQEAVIADARVDVATTVVDAAEADLRLAEINLASTEIRALYDGVVTQRLTEAGAYVQTGEPVVRMIADQSLEIEADVPYQRLGGLEPGAAIQIGLDDGTTHRAVVRAVVPQENPLTRTRAVRFVAEFGETETPLAASQSVTLHVPVGARREVLTVHKDAIIKRGDRNLVYVVGDGAAEMRPVMLGAANGSRFEVLDGLAEGDQVVVRGNERLRPGDKVRIEGAS